MTRERDSAAGDPRPQTGQGRLRIVLATQALDGPGGSESYALTVAHELVRLGHEVTLTAERLGPVADLAESQGLRLARDPFRLPPNADGVLVQDRIVSAKLVARYPRAQVVHVCHSDLFDHQLPTFVSGAVDTVVVLSERVGLRVRGSAIKAPVVRLRQPIATDWFRPMGPLPARPRRAVLLGNYLAGDRRAALLRAWGSRGVECVQVGMKATFELDVLPAITAADIVVAKGRAALEGMSCGRAVYIYDGFGGDGWVTPETYPALEADAFGGLATGGPRSPKDLVGDLDLYDPDMGWINNELVRSHHSARRHAAQLVELLAGVEPAERPALDAAQEIAGLTRLLLLSESRGQDQLIHASASERAATAEIDRWRQRAEGAERDGRELALEAERGRERATELERQLSAARRLLATRRARVGLSAGRTLDRILKRG